MIKIKKSPTADTRTCDWSKVTKDNLLEASRQHISDVEKGLEFFAHALRCRGRYYELGAHLVNPDHFHDHDKLSAIDHFHSDFRTGFKEHGWWDNHRKVNRHHIDKPDGIPEAVDLIDVLEHVADCVMAGMARSGSLYALDLPDEILQRALKNTVELLKENVVVEK